MYVYTHEYMHVSCCSAVQCASGTNIHTTFSQGCGRPLFSLLQLKVLLVCIILYVVLALKVTTPFPHLGVIVDLCIVNVSCIDYTHTYVAPFSAYCLV